MKTKNKIDERMEKLFFSAAENGVSDAIEF